MNIIDEIRMARSDYFAETERCPDEVYLSPEKYRALYCLAEEKCGFQGMGIVPRLFFKGTEIIKDCAVKDLYIPHNLNKTRQVDDE